MFCKKKNRYYREDRIAMRIAGGYGLTHEYKTARRHGLKPLDALADWDMLTPESLALLEGLHNDKI